MSERRFILFGFLDCYPNGGAGDIRGVFSTADEARAEIQAGDGKFHYDNYQIYDIEKHDVVDEFRTDHEAWPNIVREITDGDQSAKAEGGKE
jgi:hypothetical protein